MRSWVLVSLLAAGLTAIDVPVAAGTMSGHGPVVATFPSAASRPIFRRHAPFVLRHRLARHGFSSGVPLLFSGPVLVPEDFADPAGGTAPVIVLNAGPAALPPQRRVVDDRPSVEQTPQGVVIVRGPGSRHTQP